MEKIVTVSNFSDHFEGLTDKEIIDTLTNIMICYPNPKLLYQPERLSEEARKGCDSPNTPTKGSESTRNE